MRAIDADALSYNFDDMMAVSPTGYIHGDTIADMIGDAPTIEPEPQWIPCSKELPKIGNRVIGTYKNSLFKNGPYVVRVMRREKKYWVGDDEHWFLYENIIAWMPLPEPHKEVDA